jgi:large subunit ribosomal protein L1
MAKKQKAEAPAEGQTPTASVAEVKKPAESKPRKKSAAPPAESAGAAAAPGPAVEAAPAGAAAPPRPAGDAKPKGKGKRPGQAPPRGKKLRNHLLNMHQKLVKEGPRPLAQAVNLLKKIKRAKFDETVEVHMSLGVDAGQSDQAIRGTVSLPHGVGKPVRVVVFCQGDNIAKAKEAGADDAGAVELIKRVQDGWLDFDVALATQDMMGQVSRLGKTLGPRGLMPTPKAGTVITGDAAQAVREFKAGKVEYRTDKGGNVHAGVGKLSFDEDKLTANIAAFVDIIKAAKPTGVKGNYIKSITVSATMSPGIPVTV